jgi:hypothetical protein
MTNVMVPLGDPSAALSAALAREGGLRVVIVIKLQVASRKQD